MHSTKPIFLSAIANFEFEFQILFPAFSKVFLNSCQIWATPVNEGISFLHSFLWRKLFSTQFSVKETVFYIVFCEGNCFLHSFLWRNFAHQWSYHRWRHYYFLRILLPRSLKLNLMQVPCMGAHSQVPSQFKKRGHFLLKNDLKSEAQRAQLAKTFPQHLKIENLLL